MGQTSEQLETAATAMRDMATRLRASIATCPHWKVFTDGQGRADSLPAASRVRPGWLASKSLSAESTLEAQDLQRLRAPCSRSQIGGFTPVLLRCSPGVLAIVIRDTAPCVQNLGRIVQVRGPVQTNAPLHLPSWLIKPITRAPYAVEYPDRVIIAPVYWKTERVLAGARTEAGAGRLRPRRSDGGTCSSPSLSAPVRHVG